MQAPGPSEVQWAVVNLGQAELPTLRPGQVIVEACEPIIPGSLGKYTLQHRDNVSKALCNGKLVLAMHQGRLAMLLDELEGPCEASMARVIALQADAESKDQKNMTLSQQVMAIIHPLFPD